jgi:hypothetical protein
LEDRWRYHVSYLLKPRRLLAVAGLTTCVLLVVTVAVWLSGFRIVSQSRAQIADLAEAAVDDIGAYSAADLRVRVAGATRALAFVDRAITGRPPDYARSAWYSRLFHRHSPEVHPGRAAVLLGLIDQIVAYPVVEQPKVIERIVLRAGGEASSWSILNVVADLPDELRKPLLDADAAQFREIIAWLKRRPILDAEAGGLLSAIRQQEAEIHDVIKAGRSTVKQMTEDLERRREANSACRRHVDTFDSCMNKSSSPSR